MTDPTPSTGQDSLDAVTTALLNLLVSSCFFAMLGMFGIFIGLHLFTATQSLWKNEKVCFESGKTDTETAAIYINHPDGTTSLVYCNNSGNVVACRHDALRIMQIDTPASSSSSSARPAARFRKGRRTS
jgi:hypothetical protein